MTERTTLPELGNGTAGAAPAGPAPTPAPTPTPAPSEGPEPPVIDLRDKPEAP
jgi:hypothetical protein